jgi:MucR family transcriptional regulator, transcriptional regulator of exopolysaccharide biosynthesis
MARLSAPACCSDKTLDHDRIPRLYGKKFKSLKRHLRTQYRMTPDQYRAKWTG